MSLEYYVASGLDDEWIASWNTHSLRAGSLAYRSYGAWYVAHPLSANYDICNTTYCQVWDGSDVYQSVYYAAEITAGIMLSMDGTVARSEYSAENNNCGCGDGYAGDGTYWPCVSDTICRGHSCFGHGRGMCQWGSSRWADAGYLWKWIVEHYYNPGGIYIGTPFVITSVSLSDTVLNRDDTFTIYYRVYSYAENAHSNILLGASIYSDSTGFISDPENDDSALIEPDTSSVVLRKFVIPDSAKEGWYDLYVALWLDVDEDGRITSKDLALYLEIKQNALYIGTTSIQEKEIVEDYKNALILGKERNINFTTLRRTRVEVNLYDADGRLVKKLLSADLKRGIHHIKISPIGLKSGIYFLVIKTERWKKTVKIVVQ